MDLKDRWWLTSIVVACATVGVVLLVMWLPNDVARWIIALSAGVFLLVLWLNPKLRFWRMAVCVVSGWIGCRAIPTVLISVNWENNTFGYLLENSVGPAFDVAAIVLASVLFTLDYFSRHPLPRGSWLKSFIIARFGGQKQIADQSSQQTQIGDVGDNATITVQQGIRDSQVSALVQAIADNKPVPVDRVQDYNAEIDVARDFTKHGQPDVAIAFLKKLWDRHLDHMSSREKFRVQANLGYAYGAKDDHDEAATFFFKAKSHQPEEEQSREIEAVAYFSLGNNEKAYQHALQVLEDFPDSESANAIRLRTAPEHVTLDELEITIPEPLRGTGEVLFALGWCALKRKEIDRAEGYARHGLSSDPESVNFKEQLATILVKKATIGVAHARDADEKTIEAVDESIALISGVLAHQKASSFAAVARFRYTRAVAYAIRGNHADAESDFRVALASQPHDPDIAKQYAIFLLERDASDVAIEVLRPTVQTSQDVGTCILFARLLGATNRSDDRKEAITALEAAYESASREHAGVRLDYLDIRCALLADAERHDDATTIIEQLPARFVSEEALNALRANALHRDGRTEAAMAAAREAVGSLNRQSAEHDQLYIAQTLTSLELHTEALATWQTLLDPSSNHPMNESALESARKCGDDKFIVDFCASLRSNGFVTPYSIELEVTTLEQYNEYDKAIDVMQQYLADPKDHLLAKTFRVRLSLIGKRLGRSELIEHDPTKLPSLESVTPHLGHAVAQILAEGPNPMDGVKYAYALVRRQFDSWEAHMTLVGIVGIGEDREIEFPELEAVKIGCAVKFKEDVTGEERWVILEDLPEPDISRQEIAPDSALACELTRKKVDGKFSLRRDPIQDRTGTILVIVSKYEYRCFDSYDNWEQRFPDKEFVRKYDLGNTSSGEPDLSIIHKSVDLKVEHTESLHKVYMEHMLSMTKFAELAKVSVIESLSYLATQEDLPVRCCRGNDEEFAAVAEFVRRQATLVLDPAALATMFVTNVFRHIEMFPLECLVSAGTLDDIRQQLLGKFAIGRSTRHIGKFGGKYVFSERTNDEIKQYENGVNDFMEWIQSIASILGGLALANIDTPKRDQLIDYFGQPTAESIAIAANEGCVLWTDDFAVAEVSASEVAVRRVWSQALFEQFVATGAMSPDILRDLSLRLIELGYAFTRLTPEIGIEAARQSKWDPKQAPLSSVAKWFCTSGVKPEGAVGLMAAILVGVWREAPIVNQREEVTKGIAEQVAQRSDGLQLLQVFIDHAASFFGVDVLSAEACVRVVKRIIDFPRGGSRLILPDHPEF